MGASGAPRPYVMPAVAACAATILACVLLHHRRWKRKDSPPQASQRFFIPLPSLLQALQDAEAGAKESSGSFRRRSPVVTSQSDVNGGVRARQHWIEVVAEEALPIPVPIRCALACRPRARAHITPLLLLAPSPHLRRRALELPPCSWAAAALAA
jgi:hypothetical protein